MITRNEYLKALDLIDLYHQQIKLSVSNNENYGKTLIIDWYNALEKKTSGRLYHLIIHNPWFLDQNGTPFKYVEDVNKREFMKLRNAGIKSWNEFCELR